MNTPYQTIGDANDISAFLTGEDGHDKATLLRRTRHTGDPGDHVVLADDEWQHLINLVDAAPKLLEAAVAIYPLIEGLPKLLSCGDGPLTEAIHSVRSAIDLATRNKA